MKTTVTKKENFLKGQKKEDFIEELKKNLDSSILEAYIFGSFFGSRFCADSDLDLLVIIETDWPFLKRRNLLPKLERFLDNKLIPYDLLVYTPKEFAELKKEGQESKVGFWKNFLLTAQQI